MNSSLGMDLKVENGVPYWSERGADTWSPFKSINIELVDEVEIKFRATTVTYSVLCTNISGYEALTADNFFLDIYKNKASATSAAGTGSLSKSYDQSTGTLTVKVTTSGTCTGDIVIYANVYCVH